MKHLIRFAAVMAAAALLALPLGAQSRGGHSSHSSSYSNNNSRSGSSYSHTDSRRGSSPSGNSAVRPSSGHNQRPNGGSTADRPQRPSGGSSANRPSGGHNQHPRYGGNSNRPNGGSSANRPSGDRPQRPNGGSSADRPSKGGHDRGHADANRPGNNNRGVRPGGGGSHRPNPGAHRPAPGSRPYADGRRPHPGNMGRVHVNPRPGVKARRPEHRELRGAPVHFSHRGPHGYGYFVTSIPGRYERRHYRGIDYYYWNNVWYRYFAGRYWVCRPPFGYVFTPIEDAVFAACAFSYYYDRYYYYDNVAAENARILNEQNKQIAENNAIIAQQNQTIAMNASLAKTNSDLANSLGLVQSYASVNTEYYYNDGVFYVKDADGQYSVIVPPAGAMVESLPEDYEEIELGGNTYYKVDNTVYKMTVTDGGKACFEVLGQFAE